MFLPWFGTGTAAVSHQPVDGFEIHVGHGDDVGHFALGGDLPPVEDFLRGAVEYHGGRVPVSPGADAVFVEPLHGVLGSVQHTANGLSPSIFAVTVDGVPEHERGEAVAGTGQGGVVDAGILDGSAQGFDQVFAGDDDTARQGCADQFVAADGDAVDPGVEPERLWVIHVGQDHSAERCVGVDVVFPDAQLVNDLSDRWDVVHGAAHGGADGGQNDGRPVPMDGQHVPEVVVVDLAVGPSFDRGVGHVEDAGNLEDGVVGFLGEVEHTFGMEFPSQVEAVHVAFGAARGDVAPGGLWVQAHELGEVEDDLLLELMGVGPVVGPVEGVSDIVEGVVEEWDERGVVEVLVGGVAHLPLLLILDYLE